MNAANQSSPSFPDPATLRREIWLRLNRLGALNGSELSEKLTQDPVLRWLFSPLEINPLTDLDSFYASLAESFVSQSRKRAA